MGETGTTQSPPPWAAQTLGQRIVTAAWQAVAAHLAAAEQQRVAAGGAGELDPAPDALPASVADRLR